jgi:hypothetical protein
MGAMLAQMGVRWVRLEFHIEGSNALAQVARNDYFIREVAPRHNLKVLGLLSFGLVRGSHPRTLGAHTSTHDPIYGMGIDDVQRRWLDRARMIADRYEGQIAAYETFNEPNRITETGDEGIPAAEIARLHATFYRFFRHEDRNAPGNQAWRDAVPIILGGPQPAGTGALNSVAYLSDRTYLRQLYSSAAFVSYYASHGRYPLDGLGYHPYPQEIHRSLVSQQETWINSRGEIATTSEANQTDENLTTPQRDVEVIMGRLDSIRATLESLGDGQQPFWLTEVGYNAAFEERGEVAQAEFLRQVYTQVAARDDVARIFWFKYEDFPPAVGPGAQQWGQVVIPFVQDTACPGGACYDAEGRPVRLREAFWAYRELSGAARHMPEPPEYVQIDGVTAGTTGQELSFTALVSRTTALAPMQYTWHMHGQDTERLYRSSGISDTVSLVWHEPGTYTLAVEAANDSGTVINSHVVHIRPAPAGHATP